jgi:hypothetical protein
MNLEHSFSLDRADQSNDLVPLLLGAISFLDDFAAAAEQGSRARRTQEEREDGAVLAAALGLLSLRRTLRRWALVAAHDYESPPTQLPADQPATPGAVSLR